MFRFIIIVWNMLRFVSQLIRRLLGEKTTPAIAKTSAAENPLKGFETGTKWSDILKDQDTEKAGSKRLMLYPSNVVSLFRTDSETRCHPRSNDTKEHEGIDIIFKFFYVDQTFLVAVRRPFTQAVKEDGFKKIVATMHRRIKAANLEKPHHFEFTPIPEFEVTETTTCEEFLANTRAHSMNVNGEVFRIVRGRPYVFYADLYLTPIVGTPCFPAMDFDNAEKIDLIYHWFVSKEENDRPTGKKYSKKTKELERLALNLDYLDEKERTFKLDGFEYKHTGPYYEPTVADLKRRVAFVVDSGPDFPVQCALSGKYVIDYPTEIITDCQMEWCKNNMDISTNTIRTMSYNILADHYLNLKINQAELFYKFCDKFYQRIFYRTPLFFKQIREFIEGGVELMFFQEVDAKRFEHSIQPWLEFLDYECIFAKKLERVREGSAIGFSKRFELISSDIYSVAQLAIDESVPENEDIRRILNSSEPTKAKMVDKKTVTHIIVLKDTKTDKIVVAANTHLHHNPLDEQIKIMQAVVSLRKVLSVYKEAVQTYNIPVRIIFGGDFNSLPDGPVFNLFTTGKLEKDHAAWKLDENLASEDIKLSEDGFVMSCLSGTPEYTNYTVDPEHGTGFKGCLDYVWGLDVTAGKVCPMPSHEKVTRYTALPSPISPSDHLPVIVDIEI